MSKQGQLTRTSSERFFTQRAFSPHTVNGSDHLKTSYLVTAWSKVVLDKLTGCQLVKKFPAFYGTQKVSLPHSQVPATCPYPEPAWSTQSISPGPRLTVWTLSNMILFFGEELLAPRPTPKLEDHPLSAVRDCLFNIFAATLHIGGRSFIRNLRTPHAVVTLI